MDQTEQPKRPRGRPRKLTGEPVNMTVRISEEHRDKFDRLGGTDWLRAKLDEAPDPGEGARARGAWIKGQEGAE